MFFVFLSSEPNNLPGKEMTLSRAEESCANELIKEKSNRKKKKGFK
jgi:hypothetical protein